jgi:hypothetical protein
MILHAHSILFTRHVLPPFAKRAALKGVAGLRSGPSQADPQRTKQLQERKNNETFLTDADHFSKMTNASVASLRS